MNWDAIGAIADLLAAIGVIISLVFVGLQIRKGNAEARAATMQATTDTEMTMLSILANHAEVWEKVTAGTELQPGTETRTAILLFASLMIDYENRFHQNRAGNYDERTWANRRSNLRKLTTLPIYDLWRQSPGGRARSADWTDFLDSLVAEVRAEP